MLARGSWLLVPAVALVLGFAALNPPMGPPGAPVVDVTPYDYAKQDYNLCAVTCFATLYRQSTVPYISLDQPRAVTLVYNSDRVNPMPFVHVNVTPDLGFGQTPTEYRLQVKVNGSFVTFRNGEQMLRFNYPGAASARLGAQFDATSYATGVYPMDILVSALYPDSSVITNDVPTKLVVVNETNSAIAAGWTLAGIQRLYLQADSTALITEGDGSADYFGRSGSAYIAPGGEFSQLVATSPSGWLRRYPDSTIVVFDGTGRMVERRDRFNNTTTLTYDGSGRVWQIKDPLNLAYTLSYGTNGLASIQDPGSPARTTTVTVDASRHITAMMDPDNVSTRFVTDAAHLLSKVFNRRGDSTTYAYHTSRKLQSVTSPPVPIYGLGNLSPTDSQYSWQVVGVPYTPTSPTPAAAPLADTVRGRMLDASGFQTSVRVDRFGAITRTDDPLGRTTTFKRDTNALVVRDSFPSGRIDTTSYNTSGLPIMIQSAGLSAINHHYAAYGQSDSIWGAGRQTVRNFIGVNGRIDSTSIGGQARSKYTYDTHGRVLSATDPQGHLLVQHTYSGTNGNVSKDSLTGGRVTTHLYDPFGRDTAVQQPSRPLRRTRYDQLNRVTQVYDGVNANPTSLSYDSLFVRSVTDPKGQVYGFTFNALAWMTQRTDPAGRAEQYLYDKVGNLKRWTNRRGDSLVYTYDALRRRIIKGGSNTSSESWSYSTNGLVITTTSPVDTESVYFSVFGQPDSVKTKLANQTFWRRYRYTPAGLVDSVDITGGGISFKARKYLYNAGLGTLIGIRLGGVSSNLVANADLQDTSITFPGSDRRSQQYYPLHSATQFSTSAAYNLTIARSVGFDSVGQIRMQVVGNGSTGDRYTYDGLGRLLADSIVSNPSPPASCSGTPPPTIDAYGNSCVNAGGWNAVSGAQFAYDLAGNRTDLGGSYSSGNRISAFGQCTYTTDFDGNVTKRTCTVAPGTTQTLDLTWSAESRLTAAVTCTFYPDHSVMCDYSSVFDYDALGRLVRKDDGDPSYFLWDRFSLLAELTSTGTATVAEYSYYPGLDHLHALIVGGQQYNAHTDAIGDVIALTDGAQAVQRTYQYGAWGQLTGGTDFKPFNDADRARWKGALSFWPGLYYMRNRWYEPYSGRFLSEDPLNLAGIAQAPQVKLTWNGLDMQQGLTPPGTGQLSRPVELGGRRSPKVLTSGSSGRCGGSGTNAYVYADNNPTSGSDPSGLDDVACAECWIVFVIVVKVCNEQGWPPPCEQLVTDLAKTCVWICGISPNLGGGGGDGGGGGGGGGGDFGGGCGWYDIYIDGYYAGSSYVCNAM
jgi:RHS repeat-associated protein